MTIHAISAGRGSDFHLAHAEAASRLAAVRPLGGRRDSTSLATSLRTLFALFDGSVDLRVAGDASPGACLPRVEQFE